MCTTFTLCAPLSHNVRHFHTMCTTLTQCAPLPHNVHHSHTVCVHHSHTRTNAQKLKKINPKSYRGSSGTLWAEPYTPKALT